MLSAILQAQTETDQVTRLLHTLRTAPRSAADIMTELRLSHRPTFRRNYLHPALAAGLIEMTQPATPSARNQKYQLTARGQQSLAQKRRS